MQQKCDACETPLFYLTHCWSSFGDISNIKDPAILGVDGDCSFDAHISSSHTGSKNKNPLHRKSFKWSQHSSYTL